MKEKLLTRRRGLVVGTAAGAGLVFTPLMARAAEVDALISGFTGGADAADGGIDLTAPEIAENGNTVPVEVAAEGASAIMVIAAGNPEGNVCTANFGPKAGARRVSTRIRLAKTQEVIALAKLEDGKFVKASKEVKVTIGGCGG